MLKAEKFSFASQALPEDTFGVVRFEGFEGLSNCYQFDITLVSNKADVDLTAILQSPAVFTILRDDGNIPYHGILLEFIQMQAFDEYVFYRAVLAPKLAWLKLTHHNQVFLNMTVPEILEAVLKDAGLSSNDFELRLRKEYEAREYVCQYRESHYSFTARWMEREGIYYYFEQTDGGEKIILTDTGLAHTEMPQGRALFYSPPSGLDETHREEVLNQFICRQRMLPQKVLLKDYNYRTPSLEVSGEADVMARGRGEVFMYGDHFFTPEEGDRLAHIRAEELLCREKTFEGDSTVPFLRPGYVFELQDHYRGDFNQTYLTVDLHHHGSQTGYLVSGIQKALSDAEQEPYYRNSFTLIPSNVQFRPERKTEKARFYGTLNARIDAAGTGHYAELDEEGRYKVILPFDLSGRKDGKASAFLRMAQPYAGADHGMHFPLHKGTEVLLTFIDGDPDRPIIAASVPNPVNPSMVKSGNQTMSAIRTAGGNQLTFQDRDGDRRISMGIANGAGQVILSEGASTSYMSKTDFEARSSNYIMTEGSLVKTALSSFSHSSIAGAWLWTLISNLLSLYANNVYKADKLGHEIGAMEEDEHYKGHSAELMIALQAAPIALNILFTNWLVYSMAKALQKDAMFRLTANFGNVTEKVRKKYDKETYSGRLRLVSKGMAWLAGMFRAYGLGNTGSYGVCLFSRCSAEYEQSALMWATKIFDPRVGSLLKLTPGLPDILIASNKGYVDLAGEKGINLFSTEKVAADSEDIILQARSQAAITGNGASINIGLGSMSAPPPLIPTNEIEMDGEQIHIGTKKATKGVYVNGEEILVGITDPFRNLMDKPWKGSAKYLVNYASEYIGIGKEPSDAYGASSAKNVNLIFTKTPRVDVSSTTETNVRSDKNVNIGVLKPPDKPTQNVTINALKKVEVESQKDVVIKSNATINLNSKMMIKARGMKLKFA